MFSQSIASTSTRVAGGKPMDPLHESNPWQSPVWHAGLVPDSKLHPVRPQKRPFHLGGALTCFVWPGWRRNPPSANTGFPEFGAIAGHTGQEHLFLMWNVTIWPSATAPIIILANWLDCYWISFEYRFVESRMQNWTCCQLGREWSCSSVHEKFTYQKN